ncbi:microsomal signal peptidase 12kDa subunit [Kockiozyma suomiensis]|uniref:microsomal signal peptidase 12kDa subunit n=1 Tax=Kockiozyma suomiensis TaxID=1337062 RepID=UPI003343B916
MSSHLQTIILEGSIDLVGQQLADSITSYYVSFAGIIGFLSGFISQDIKLTVYICSVLFTIGLFVVVFPWPFYKRHPLRFLKHEKTN